MNYLSLENIWKSYGEKILFENISLSVNKGQKVAQAVLCPVVNGKWVTLVEKNKLEDKDRNQNGFGSTGIWKPKKKY